MVDEALDFYEGHWQEWNPEARRAREHEARRTANEVWSVGKHVQKKCSASKRKRNTRGTYTAECRASDARRRRTSIKISSTGQCTTARSMKRACRNGQTRCSQRSRKPSANLKLERELYGIGGLQLPTAPSMGEALATKSLLVIAVPFCTSAMTARRSTSQFSQRAT